MSVTLNSEASVVQTAKFTFSKKNGGSKTISVPSPRDQDQQAQADINGFADYVEEYSTLGGGLSTKSYVIDKTQRVTFKPKA